MIVIPYHPAPGRERVASFVKLRYQALHPGWPIVMAGDGGEPWSKARAVNRAVECGIPGYKITTKATVIIVADADCCADSSALVHCVEAVEGGAPWAVPFGMVFRLSKDATNDVLAGDIDIEPTPTIHVDPARPSYIGLPGGGVLVCSRESWATVGGYDERFEGWRGEDVSLGWALDTLAGPHVRSEAALWHLAHPPAVRVREAMEANYQLELAYRRAQGRPRAMRSLVTERA